jgi:phenylacetate-coenzyme A ligase PaaK-like adenylate-forming protein
MNISTFLRTKLKNRRDRRLPQEELQARRLAKFRRLVEHARRHSPYYSGLIEDLGINPGACAPEDFPVLTKREVMENFNRLVTDRSITKAGVEEFLSSSKNPLDMYRGSFYVLHTSGSSGEIGLYVYSPDDIARGMAQTPTPPWVGLRRCRTAFFGATKGHFAGVTFASILRGSALKFLFRSQVYEINSPLPEVIKGLNAFRPDVVAGYATALKILGDKLIDGSLKIAPKLLLSSGEPLNSNDRAFIESTFRAPLVNSYMCTEHVYLGIGRAEYKGMYLLEDDLIFEFHPDHTCITNLFNYTMPLIRYRMEDVLVPVRDTEKVLPFTKVREIVGRSEYIPYFEDICGKEDFISPHIINEFFVKNLKRFQMQVIDKRSFVFKTVAAPGLDEDKRTELFRAIKERLTGILSEKGLDNVTFEIEEVDDLPMDPKTGKFKLILPPPPPGA